MDHVPPRAIFPDKLPAEVRMVTAPACTVCHKENQKDDATIRNLLISAEDVEQHPTIVRALGGKRDRGFKRSLKFPEVARHATASSRSVEMISRNYNPKPVSDTRPRY
jgi:hypothetical protein